MEAHPSPSPVSPLPHLPGREKPVRLPVLLVLNLGDFVCINTFSITNTKPELKHEASEKTQHCMCCMRCLALLIMAKNRGLWTLPLPELCSPCTRG